MEAKKYIELLGKPASIEATGGADEDVPVYTGTEVIIAPTEIDSKTAEKIKKVLLAHARICGYEGQEVGIFIQKGKAQWCYPAPEWYEKFTVE